MLSNARALKRLLFIVDLSQVFKRLAVEKDRSGVHDVAGLTSSNFNKWIMLGISPFSPLEHLFTASYISLKHVTFLSD